MGGKARWRKLKRVVGPLPQGPQAPGKQRLKKERTKTRDAKRKRMGEEEDEEEEGGAIQEVKDDKNQQVKDATTAPVSKMKDDLSRQEATAELNVNIKIEDGARKTLSQDSIGLESVKGKENLGTNGTYGLDEMNKTNVMASDYDKDSESPLAEWIDEPLGKTTLEEELKKAREEDGADIDNLPIRAGRRDKVCLSQVSANKISPDKDGEAADKSLHSDAEGVSNSEKSVKFFISDDESDSDTAIFVDACQHTLSGDENVHAEDKTPTGNERLNDGMEEYNIIDLRTESVIEHSLEGDDIELVISDLGDEDDINYRETLNPLSEIVDNEGVMANLAISPDQISNPLEFHEARGSFSSNLSSPGNDVAHNALGQQRESDSAVNYSTGDATEVDSVSRSSVSDHASHTGSIDNDKARKTSTDGSLEPDALSTESVTESTDSETMSRTTTETVPQETGTSTTERGEADASTRGSTLSPSGSSVSNKYPGSQEMSPSETQAPDAASTTESESGDKEVCSKTSVSEYEAGRISRTSVSESGETYDTSRTASDYSNSRTSVSEYSGEGVSRTSVSEYSGNGISRASISEAGETEGASGASFGGTRERTSKSSVSESTEFDSESLSSTTDLSTPKEEASFALDAKVKTGSVDAAVLSEGSLEDSLLNPRDKEEKLVEVRAGSPVWEDLDREDHMRLVREMEQPEIPGERVIKEADAQSLFFSLYPEYQPGEGEEVEENLVKAATGNPKFPCFRGQREEQGDQEDVYMAMEKPEARSGSGRKEKRSKGSLTGKINQIQNKFSQQKKSERENKSASEPEGSSSRQSSGGSVDERQDTASGTSSDEQKAKSEEKGDDSELSYHAPRDWSLPDVLDSASSLASNGHVEEAQQPTNNKDNLVCEAGKPGEGADINKLEEAAAAVVSDAVKVEGATQIHQETAAITETGQEALEMESKSDNSTKDRKTLVGKAKEWIKGVTRMGSRKEEIVPEKVSDKTGIVENSKEVSKAETKKAEVQSVEIDDTRSKESSITSESKSSDDEKGKKYEMNGLQSQESVNNDTTKQDASTAESEEEKETGSVSNGGPNVENHDEELVDTTNKEEESVDMANKKEESVDVATKEQVSVDVATKEQESVDVATKEQESVDVATKEQVSVDVATKEKKSVDVATKEQEFMDVATKEQESVDVATKEQESVDVATKELESVDVATKEQESVDVATKEQESVDVATKEQESVDVTHTEAQTTENEGIKEVKDVGVSVKVNVSDEAGSKEKMEAGEEAKETTVSESSTEHEDENISVDVQRLEAPVTECLEAEDVSVVKKSEEGETHLEVTPDLTRTENVGSDIFPEQTKESEIKEINEEVPKIDTKTENGNGTLETNSDTKKYNNPEIRTSLDGEPGTDIAPQEEMPKRRKDESKHHRKGRENSKSPSVCKDADDKTRSPKVSKKYKEGKGGSKRQRHHRRHTKNLEETKTQTAISQSTNAVEAAPEAARSPSAEANVKDEPQEPPEGVFLDVNDEHPQQEQDPEATDVVDDAEGETLVETAEDLVQEITDEEPGQDITEKTADAEKETEESELEVVIKKVEELKGDVIPATEDLEPEIKVSEKDVVHSDEEQELVDEATENPESYVNETEEKDCDATNEQNGEPEHEAIETANEKEDVDVGQEKTGKPDCDDQGGEEEFGVKDNTLEEQASVQDVSQPPQAEHRASSPWKKGSARSSKDKFSDEFWKEKLSSGHRRREKYREEQKSFSSGEYDFTSPSKIKTGKGDESRHKTGETDMSEKAHRDDGTEQEKLEERQIASPSTVTGEGDTGDIIVPFSATSATWSPRVGRKERKRSCRKSSEHNRERKSLEKAEIMKPPMKDDLEKELDSEPIEIPSGMTVSSEVPQIGSPVPPSPPAEIKINSPPSEPPKEQVAQDSVTTDTDIALQELKFPERVSKPLSPSPSKTIDSSRVPVPGGTLKKNKKSDKLKHHKGASKTVAAISESKTVAAEATEKLAAPSEAPPKEPPTKDSTATDIGTDLLELKFPAGVSKPLSPLPPKIMNSTTTPVPKETLKKKKKNGKIKLNKGTSDDISSKTETRILAAETTETLQVPIETTKEEPESQDLAATDTATTLLELKFPEGVSKPLSPLPPKIKDSAKYPVSHTVSGEIKSDETKFYKRVSEDSSPKSKGRNPAPKVPSKTPPEATIMQHLVTNSDTALLELKFPEGVTKPLSPLSTKTIDSSKAPVPDAISKNLKSHETENQNRVSKDDSQVSNARIIPLEAPSAVPPDETVTQDSTATDTVTTLLELKFPEGISKPLSPLPPKIIDSSKGPVPDAASKKLKSDEKKLRKRVSKDDSPSSKARSTALEAPSEALPEETVAQDSAATDSGTTLLELKFPEGVSKPVSPLPPKITVSSKAPVPDAASQKPKSDEKKLRKRVLKDDSPSSKARSTALEAPSEALPEETVTQDSAATDSGTTLLELKFPEGVSKPVSPLPPKITDSSKAPVPDAASQKPKSDEKKLRKRVLKDDSPSSKARSTALEAPSEALPEETVTQDSAATDSGTTLLELKFPEGVSKPVSPLPPKITDSSKAPVPDAASKKTKSDERKLRKIFSKDDSPSSKARRTALEAPSEALPEETVTQDSAATDSGTTLLELKFPEGVSKPLSPLPPKTTDSSKAPVSDVAFKKTISDERKLLKRVSKDGSPESKARSISSEAQREMPLEAPLTQDSVATDIGTALLELKFPEGVSKPLSPLATKTIDSSKAPVPDAISQKPKPDVTVDQKLISKDATPVLKPRRIYLEAQSETLSGETLAQDSAATDSGTTLLELKFPEGVSKPISPLPPKITDSSKAPVPDAASQKPKSDEKKLRKRVSKDESPVSRARSIALEAQSEALPEETVAQDSVETDSGTTLLELKFPEGVSKPVSPLPPKIIRSSKAPVPDAASKKKKKDERKLRKRVSKDSSSASEAKSIALKAPSTASPEETVTQDSAATDSGTTLLELKFPEGVSKPLSPLPPKIIDSSKAPVPDAASKKTKTDETVGKKKILKDAAPVSKQRSVAPEIPSEALPEELVTQDLASRDSDTSFLELKFPEGVSKPLSPILPKIIDSSKAPTPRMAPPEETVAQDSAATDTGTALLELKFPEGVSKPLSPLSPKTIDSSKAPVPYTVSIKSKSDSAMGQKRVSKDIGTVSKSRRIAPEAASAPPPEEPITQDPEKTGTDTSLLELKFPEGVTKPLSPLSPKIGGTSKAPVSDATSKTHKSDKMELYKSVLGAVSSISQFQSVTPEILEESSEVPAKKLITQGRAATESGTDLLELKFPEGVSEPLSPELSKASVPEAPPEERASQDSIATETGTTLLELKFPEGVSKPLSPLPPKIVDSSKAQVPEEISTKSKIGETKLHKRTSTAISPPLEPQIVSPEVPVILESPAATDTVTALLELKFPEKVSKPLSPAPPKIIDSTKAPIYDTASETPKSDERKLHKTASKTVSSIRVLRSALARDTQSEVIPEEHVIQDSAETDTATLLLELKFPEGVSKPLSPLPPKFIDPSKVPVHDETSKHPKPDKTRPHKKALKPEKSSALEASEIQVGTSEPSSQPTIRLKYPEALSKPLSPQPPISMTPDGISPPASPTAKTSMSSEESPKPPSPLHKTPRPQVVIPKPGIPALPPVEASQGLAPSYSLPDLPALKPTIPVSPLKTLTFPSGISQPLSPDTKEQQIAPPAMKTLQVEFPQPARPTHQLVEPSLITPTSPDTLTKPAPTIPPHLQPYKPEPKVPPAETTISPKAFSEVKPDTEESLLKLQTVKSRVHSVDRASQVTADFESSVTKICTASVSTMTEPTVKVHKSSLSTTEALKGSRFSSPSPQRIKSKSSRHGQVRKHSNDSSTRAQTTKPPLKPKPSSLTHHTEKTSSDHSITTVATIQTLELTEPPKETLPVLSFITSAEPVGDTEIKESTKLTTTESKVKAKDSIPTVKDSQSFEEYKLVADDSCQSMECSKPAVEDIKSSKSVEENGLIPEEDPKPTAKSSVAQRLKLQETVQPVFTTKATTVEASKTSSSTKLEASSPTTSMPPFKVASPIPKKSSPTGKICPIPKITSPTPKVISTSKPGTSKVTSPISKMTSPIPKVSSPTPLITSPTRQITSPIPKFTSVTCSITSSTPKAEITSVKTATSVLETQVSETLTHQSTSTLQQSPSELLSQLKPTRSSATQTHSIDTDISKSHQLEPPAVDKLPPESKKPSSEPDVDASNLLRSQRFELPSHEALLSPHGLLGSSQEGSPSSKEGSQSPRSGGDAQKRARRKKRR